jgi:hypothetical protein
MASCALALDLWLEQLPAHLSAATGHVITAVTAIVARERGYRHALAVLDTIRAINDPRSPSYWQRTRPKGRATKAPQ